MGGRDAASQLQQWVLHRVERSSKRENQPIFVSIDDTICQKTKPRHGNTRHSRCDWHYSHAEKSRLGTFSRLAHGSYDDPSVSFCLSPLRQDGGESKGELAIEMLSSLDVSRPRYVLMTLGIHRNPRGSLLKKRVPRHRDAEDESDSLSKRDGHSSKEFAKSMEPRDTRLVTVGKERYRVYRYEGALNGLKDAVVLLAWKADQPMTPKHLHWRLEHRSRAKR
ncbi:hypothetical protein [Anoxybacillus flavithermus]|uniref:hypothetical protein n=1 Tax=Anoxybacillus flavithermus TaxID=33934 RepID=UPI0002E53FCF